VFLLDDDNTDWAVELDVISWLDGVCAVITLEKEESKETQYLVEINHTLSTYFRHQHSLKLLFPEPPSQYYYSLLQVQQNILEQ
jgi:hypothetical protein